LKANKDFAPELKRAFRFEILDNNKIIYSKKGWNSINLSHFMFRANQGLPETSENSDVEVKHNYVI